MSDVIQFSIETQSFRATPSEPVSISDAVDHGGASTNGEYAVIEHEEPKAMIVIGPDGTLLIHGISDIDAATMIAEEILLRMGMSESGLLIEQGEVLASFSIGKAVLF